VIIGEYSPRRCRSEYSPIIFEPEAEVNNCFSIFTQVFCVFWDWIYFNFFINREFKLRVIRQTANARQRKFLLYQAIKSKWTSSFKTEIHNYSFDARKKIWNENVQRKFCQENSNLPFAVPGNVKPKLPNNCIKRLAAILQISVLLYSPA
jgi:hypothetical protein